MTTTPAVKLRTIIADDEPLLRQELRRKLENYPNIEIVAECENGLQAVEAANRLQPDLMYLDIVMPGLDGFEVIEALQSDAMPVIVFATAYDQFAIKAFDVRAVDYLVKPYSDERLMQSVETALLSHKENPGLKKSDMIEVNSYLKNREITDNNDVVDSGRWPQEIVIENKDPQITVKVEDIAWVDAAGDYMCVHANDETYIMRTTMKRLVKLLNPEQFKRIHRSTIVNVNFVEQIQPFRKGDYFVILRGGTQLRLSRSYNNTLRSLEARIEAQTDIQPTHSVEP